MRISTFNGSNEVKWKFWEFIGNVRKFYGQAKEFLSFAVRALLSEIGGG